ncbi:insulinase family protein [bacterium]|nr:insulinase family protein [bacterium]
MFKIGSKIINSIHFKGVKDIPEDKTQEVQLKTEINELQQTSPDYQVKTPMGYTPMPDLKLPNDLTAKCYKLANGQKVVILPKKGTTTIRTYVNTGSMNEPDNMRGISHYIEHNLFNGSEGLNAGEFFQKVHEMGGNTNASTGFDQTNYYISSNLLNGSDLEQMVKLHASMLETPKFTPDTLEKEKGIVCSEINMITQNPENLVVNKAIKNLYNIKTNSADMIGGTTDNISKLTRDDVIKYYNDNYFPANMTTVLTGDVSPDEGIKLISKYFSSMNTPKNPQKEEKLSPITKIKREDILSDKASSTQLAIAINGPQNSNLKEKLALDCAFEFLTGGLSSRINSKLRDDDVFVSYFEERFGNKPESNTVRILEAESDDESIEKALTTILTEIKNLEKNPITEKELETIKKTAIKYNLMAFEDNFQINEKIGDAFLNGNMDSAENYEKIMNSISLDDVKNAIGKYLSKENFSISVIHPAESTPASIKQHYNKANNIEVNFTGNENVKQKQKPNQTKSVSARNVKPLDLSNVKNYTLPNNINLVTNDTKEQIGYIKLMIDRKEIDKTHPVESMLLNRLLQDGTLKQNDVEFSKELKDKGIRLNISAGAEYISATADYYNKDFNSAFEKLKENIYSPRFTEEEFKKEKEFIKKDLLLREKSAYDKLFETLDPETCLSKEKIIEKLDELTLEDVKNLYKNILSNAKITTAVSGPIDSDTQFKQNVFTQLSSLPNVEKNEYQLKDIYKPIEKTKVLTDTDSKNQAEILEHFRFKVNQNEHDSVTLVLLNKILGGTPSSRLFLDLREKQQLAYRVKSEFNLNDDENQGEITLSIGTTTENKETGEVSYDNIKKSIEGFNKNIEKIKTEKVSEEELENAKLNLKNTILNGIQTTEDKNFELANSFLRPAGLQSLNKIMEEIDKVTADDIYNAANYVFSTNPAYSILATENSLKANEEFIKSLEK